LFRTEKTEYQGLTPKRFVFVLGASCLALTVAIFLALGLLVLLTSLGLPIQSSYEGFVLGPQQLANPWNIVLLFATVTVGAAVFEELVFRRTLIPTLEVRGMSPTAAVIASSLGFALIHVPNDVLNGSLGFVISHFITTTIIGLVFGFVYVLTRNVLFPMIIHGFINGISFGEAILFELFSLGVPAADLLLVSYSLMLFVFWIIAIIMGVYALFAFLSTDPPDWVRTMKEKSPINVLPGLAGFLIIAFGLVSFQTIVELFLILPDVILLYTLLFLFYLAYFLIVIWIVKQTRYEPKTEPEPPTRIVYDKAEDVKLEPLPE
jgi:membrane protease YdiL (CAAX protease family)